MHRWILGRRDRRRIVSGPMGLCQMEIPSTIARLIFLVAVPSAASAFEQKGGSSIWSSSPYHANLNPPRCHLPVFLLAHEVQLRSAGVAVPGKFPHLVPLA